MFTTLKNECITCLSTATPYDRDHAVFLLISKPCSGWNLTSVHDPQLGYIPHFGREAPTHSQLCSKPFHPLQSARRLWNFEHHSAKSSSHRSKKPPRDPQPPSHGVTNPPLMQKRACYHSMQTLHTIYKHPPAMLNDRLFEQYNSTRETPSHAAASPSRGTGDFVAPLVDELFNPLRFIEIPIPIHLVPTAFQANSTLTVCVDLRAMRRKPCEEP